MNITSSAVAHQLPGHAVRTLRVVRPQKPVRKSSDLHFSKLFNPLSAQEILSSTVKQLMNEITGHVVVTSTIDASGVNLVLSSSDYQISLIFSDLKTQYNG
jgi:hypothetical protein